MPAYTECITNKQGHCIADGHRYRRVTIGAALLVGQRAFSLTWGRARNGARRG